MWEIYRELALLLAEPAEFSEQLWLDMHGVRASLLDGEGRPREDVSDWVRRQLRFCAYRISRDLGGRRLPEIVHNMMLLGEQDERTRKYVLLCESREKACTKRGC